MIGDAFTSMGGDPRTGGTMEWSTIYTKLQSMGESMNDEEIACFLKVQTLMCSRVAQSFVCWRSSVHRLSCILISRVEVVISKKIPSHLVALHSSSRRPQATW